VLLDISEGGLRLSTGETLGWDDAVPLSLQLSYRPDPLEAMGRIIWISDSKRTAGLQFISMSEMSRAKLRDWIAGEKNHANLPPAVDRPAKRPIDFPSPSSETAPKTADQPVVRAKTRSDRLWEPLLEQKPLVEREAPREPPPRPLGGPTSAGEVQRDAALNAAAFEQSVRRQPLPVPAPPFSPEPPSRWRAEKNSSPALDSGAIENPETAEPPAATPISSQVTQLPSNRLFRETARPERGQSTSGQPDTAREEHAARESHAPEQPPATADTPAAVPSPPSRWGRVEPSAAPPPQANTAAPPQTSGADSIRQAFQAKQASEEARLPGGQSPALAKPAAEAGHVSSLHDDSSSLKFAEWARARRRSGPHEVRRPSSSRAVLVGGLMLLCFAVGLIIGVSYRAGRIHIAGFTLPSLKGNGNADMTPTTPAPGAPAANKQHKRESGRQAARLKIPRQTQMHPSAPRANQDANTNSAAATGTATNNAANTKSANANTAPSNAAPNTSSPSSPELAAATKDDATPPPATAQHAAQPSSQQQTPPPQPAKPAAPSADDSLAMSHAITVTPPTEGSPAVWVRLPQIALSAPGSVAISVQQSVLVPPASTYGSARPNQVVVGGRVLNSSVQPLYSAVPIDPNGDVVHLRVWIDPQGDISQIMPGEGRADLIALAQGEVRGWVQYPPRLAGRPIDSVEDVTITFRP
jgi:hypothetical protein